jgi:DNA-binding NtrC family response regulator
MKNYSVLVVDDEVPFLDAIRRCFNTEGFQRMVFLSDPGEAAKIILSEAYFDLCLLDVNMPGMSGDKLLELIKEHNATTECIMISARDDARTALACLRKGAYDYLLKPLTCEELLSVINRSLERKRLIDLVAVRNQEGPEVDDREAFSSIVAHSEKIKRVMRESELLARSDLPILITGESGTGKELLARAIHRASGRAEKPFIAVNMAAVAGSVFESEFFGHVKGAYTGADRDRAGHIESANGGTVFLDEIGDLPLELQGKLLRVLQEKEYMKVGSSTPRKTNARFIAATNVHLERMVERGKFRPDLYYRLKGSWVHVPPLRERREDIPLLIDHFLVESGAAIQPDAFDVLMAYDYPGNVRELQSLLLSASNISGGCPISSHNFPTLIAKKSVTVSRHLIDTNNLLLSQVEKAHITSVYDLAGRNKAAAAKMLGIGLNTLRRKIMQYNID